MESVRSELVRSYIRPPPNRTACDCCFDMNCSRKSSSSRLVPTDSSSQLTCSLFTDLTASPTHRRRLSSGRPLSCLPLHPPLSTATQLAATTATTVASRRRHGRRPEVIPAAGTSRRLLIRIGGRLPLPLSCRRSKRLPKTGAKGKVAAMQVIHRTHNHPVGNSDTGSSLI